MMLAFANSSAQIVPFKSINDPAWTSGVVLIPELERSTALGSALPMSITAAIRDYVSAGHVYVVAYPASTMFFLNTVFGFSLTPCSGGTSKKMEFGSWTQEPALDVFRMTPDTLDNPDAVSGLATVDLPKGAHTVYESGAGCSMVAAMQYGFGWVIALAPDWENASTKWDEVLRLSVRVTPSRVSQPVQATPPAPLTSPASTTLPSSPPSPTLSPPLPAPVPSTQMPTHP